MFKKLKRILKKIFKGIIILFIILFLMLLIAKLINNSRKPHKNSTVMTSMLTDYILQEPQNLIYIRDFDSFLKKCRSNPILNAVFDSYLRKMQNRSGSKIKIPLIVFSIRNLISALFGNECLIYTDSDGDFYLISRTKISAQLLITLLKNYFRLFSRQDVYSDENRDPETGFYLKLNHDKYPGLFIKNHGSILTITTSKRLTYGKSHNKSESYTNKNRFISYKSPDIAIYLKDLSLIFDFMNINPDDNSPFNSIFKILTDRRMTLLSLYFETGSKDICLDFFSSSLHYDDQYINSSFKAFNNLGLDKYPLFLHSDSPKTIKITNNQLFYNEIFIFDLNVSEEPVQLYLPVNLIASSVDDQYPFPVFYADFQAIDGNLAFLEDLSINKNLPYKLFFEEKQGFTSISNQMNYENVYRRFDHLYFFKDHPERLYFYTDIQRLFLPLKPLMKLIGVFNPRFIRIMDFLDYILGLGKTVSLSFFSSKYETIFTLKTGNITN